MLALISAMNIFTSSENGYCFSRSRVSNDLRFKTYALLFDNIIYHRGWPGFSNVSKNDRSDLGMLVATSLNAKPAETELLCKSKKFASIFIESLDITAEVNSFENSWYDYLPSQLDQNIIEYWIKESSDTEFLNDLRYDIALGLWMEDQNIDAIQSYSPVTKVATGMDREKESTEIHEILDHKLLIPDVSDIDWGDILELREDVAAKKFRSLVQDAIYSGTDIQQHLIEQVNGGLWSLVSDVKPKVRQTYLEVIGANLPSPILLNPIGVATGIRDIKKSHDLVSSYNHLFFLEKARAKCS